MPEVQDFMRDFLPSFAMTLDEMYATEEDMA